MKKLNKIISLVLITLFVIEPISVSALTKKETVYTNLDSNGKVSDTKVTNHLLIDSKGSIEDSTELKDIMNLNGEEKYELKDNKLVWKSTGEDIFYEGTSKKEMPLDIKIDYFLNDKKMNLDELNGKKGKVKVVVSFENKLANDVLINGVNETMYTPFVVTMGTIINSKNNSNISVTKGKVVESGTRNIVLGVAAPGLYESIMMDEFQDLDKIVLEYETKKFKKQDMYIVATPKLMDELDFNVFDKLDSLESSVDTLQDSINKLVDGSKKLEDGTNKLETGSNTLKDGTSKLASGSLQLATGTEKLVNGSSTITENLNNVINGVDALHNGSVELNLGLQKLHGALTTAAGTLRDKNVEGSIADLTKLKDTDDVTAASLLAKTGMDYMTLQNYVMQGGSGEEYESLKSTYSLVTLLYKNSEALNGTINSLNELMTTLDQMLKGLEAATSQLESGSSNLSTKLLELKSGLEQLYAGSSSLTEGLVSANDGANKLSNGASQLDNGTKTLNDGIKKLNSGTKTLGNGLSEFNNRGIKVLNGYAKTATNYKNKLEALIDLSNEYNGYATDNASMTTFVYQVK